MGSFLAVRNERRGESKEGCESHCPTKSTQTTNRPESKSTVNPFGAIYSFYYYATLYGGGILNRTYVRKHKNLYYMSVLLVLLRGTIVNFRTAVPFWGQPSQILSTLSPKRDCGSKRVNTIVRTGTIERWRLYCNFTISLLATIYKYKYVVIYKYNLYEYKTQHTRKHKYEDGI